MGQAGASRSGSSTGAGTQPDESPQSESVRPAPYHGRDKASDDVLVGRQGQKRRQFVRLDQALENLDRLGETA